MSLAAGVRLGPYEIVSPLGTGGMGEVYRARDTRLERDVALKILPDSLVQDEDRLRRFEHEARAAGTLNHPGLLTIFDVGTCDGSPYIVSELLEGTTLRSVLESEELPLRKALDYAVQIARGLAAAHEKGIVHRDLKPENLFITRDGRAKILDFGLAKLSRPSEARAEDADAGTATSPTSPGTVMGTVGYMSPEQVRGLSADQRSDIFSLGAVLFEMLSGKRAFDRATAVETMNAILKEDPPEVSDAARPVPPALERIARRCLEKKPQERFHSAHDLALALEALSGASTGLGREGPAVPPAVVAPRRRRTAALLFLGLLGLPGIGLFAGKAFWEHPLPSFQRVTSRRGRVTSARMTSDGRTVIYGAEWEGNPVQLFSTRIEGRESSALDLPGANIASVSSAGEMAILRPEERWHTRHGLLARAHVAGGAPRDVMEGVVAADWSPDGRQLAVARVTGGKCRLEFPIGRVLHETEWIESIRVSPRGDRIAIVTRRNRGDDNVTLVDPEGKKTVLSSGSFDKIAWSPDGAEVWFTAGWQGLHAVSLSGRERVVMRLPALAHLHDITGDGRVVMAIGTRRSEIFGRAPGESRERNLSWHESSLVRDLSADGKLLLFSEQPEGTEDTNALYIRKTDGSPAVKIGEGFPALLSPDGKWVAALRTSPPFDRLSLFPTGPGETRVLSGEGIEYEYLADWAPDGKQLFLLAHERGHGARIFAQDVAGGQPHPVTPEGMKCESLSPDAATLICRDTQGRGVFYPVAGHETRPIVGLEPEDEIPRWCDGGRALCVVRREDRVHKVLRLDPITGKRTPWHEYRPADAAGVYGVIGIVETLDGRSYAYSYGRELNDLYLVDGLR